jgi:signal transduction histidine kinase
MFNWHITLKKYTSLLILLFVCYVGVIASGALLEQNTQNFDQELYLKANLCLTNAQTAGASLEIKANDLIVEWQKQFPNNYIRLYVEKEYIAGYYNIFNTSFKTFEFNPENNARFFYTKIHKEGYRGIRLQTNRIEPKHQIGNLIQIEMIENYDRRAKNAVYILLAIWLPLILFYILHFLLLRYHTKKELMDMELTFNFFKKCSENIQYAKSVPPPNIPKLYPLLEILNELCLNFHQFNHKQKTFLGDVSHQLRTPICNIQFKIDALPDSKSKDRLQDLVKNLVTLINKLLSLARLESKEIRTVKMNWFDLIYNAVIKWVPITSDYGIDFGFENEIPENIQQDVYVQCDGVMIEEALKNLIDNAIKYRKKDKNHTSIITVIIGCTNRTVWFKVKDNGKGIPPQNAEHLFNRFFRGDTENNDIKGSGLGLAIVNEVAEAHGGRIRLLQNETDTTFLFMLKRYS